MKKRRPFLKIAEEFKQVTNDPSLSKEERKRRADELLEEARPEAIEMFRPLFRGIKEFVVLFILDDIPPRKRRAKKGGAS